MKNSLENKKIGLALGGGAVLGAAHIGVLRAIEESSVEVKFISGTSIGAFIAALYAFNVKWNKIRDIAIDLNWLDISDISISRIGLLSNEDFRDIITDTIGDVDFDKSAIPLAMMATDISQGERVVINKGKVARSVMASTSIPGIFNPVEIEKRLLIDGGAVENVPVNAVRELGADYIIGVDLVASRSFHRPENILEVLLNSFHMGIISSSRLQRENADLMIVPDLSGFNMFDTDQVPDLIEKGYQEAKKVLLNV